MPPRREGDPGDFIARYISSFIAVNFTASLIVSTIIITMSDLPHVHQTIHSELPRYVVNLALRIFSLSITLPTIWYNNTNLCRNIKRCYYNLKGERPWLEMRTMKAWMEVLSVLAWNVRKLLGPKVAYAELCMHTGVVFWIMMTVVYQYLETMQPLHGDIRFEEQEAHQEVQQEGQQPEQIRARARAMARPARQQQVGARALVEQDAIIVQLFLNLVAANEMLRPLRGQVPELDEIMERMLQNVQAATLRLANGA